MALKDTLNYLLLSEYLNPQTLQKPQKEQSKYKKIYETTLDKFTDDFWHYLKQMKSISDLANNAKKHTFGIEIYGGIFELDEIGDEIIKQNPNFYKIYWQSIRKKWRRKNQTKRIGKRS